MDTNFSRTFEQIIFNDISKCLSKDETINIHPVFDFYLPDGVKKLDWPQGTAIEIKYKLLFNSLTRIESFYKRANIKKLVVIVLDKFNDGLADFYKQGLFSSEDIEMLSYEKFLKKIESIKNVNKKKGNSDWNNTNEINIDKAKYALGNNKISIFLGAGVSSSAGIATWEKILEKLCIKNNIEKIEGSLDNVVKGRYIIDEYKNKKNNGLLSNESDRIPEDFFKDMRDILYANTKKSKLIKSIANLIVNCNIESIISYNYDDLVEQEVNENRKKSCYPVFNKSRPIYGKSFPVYHVHGFIPENGPHSDIVLGEKEYHKIYQESYNWGNVEQLHALCRSTCLFIGLSMKDPNLRRLIDISVDGSELELVHYAFLRKIDYNVNITEKVLRGFGINCIWYNEHEDLPKLLDSLIEKRKAKMDEFAI